VPGFESAARFHRPEPGEGDPLGGLRYVTVYELEADTLQAPLDAVRAARDRGEIRTTDSIQRDPAPISLTFERS
jgi:hypothetical protein